MTVYLVGAGPGDPGLLTVRGAEVLAEADVVIHDGTSVADLLELAPAGAELIAVGATPGDPASVPRGVIDDLVVAHGSRRATVVRLISGDPFVFADGARQCMALAEAGVDYEVVPGVTSAIAAPAAAGIPVTLGDSSTAFTVITGHEDPAGEASIRWEAAARLGGTIVVCAGVRRWPEVAAALRAGGLDPDTPAAAVRWGTRPQQTTVRATLATLADHDLAEPATIVVGSVAAVDVGWFERLPLFGRRVVVTRTRAQASSLTHRLRRLGADVVQVPAIEIVEPDDGGRALRTAIGAIGSYEWLVLTSPNGADRFCAQLRDARQLAGVSIAAIGPGTAAALRSHNLEADLVPERFVAEGLLDVFPAPLPGGRVLLARAAEARDVLPEGLVAAGWDVDVVATYRTIPPAVTDDQRTRVTAADTITFTSSSTVTNTVAALGVDALPPVVACIGPITAATARSLGVEVTFEAEVHTIDGLIEVLCAASPGRVPPPPTP